MKTRRSSQSHDMLSTVLITFTDGSSETLHDVEALYDWPHSPCAVYRYRDDIYWYPLANIRSIVVTPTETP